VIGLTKSVANDLSPFGIRVNAISPGNKVTSMTASVTSGDPEDLERTTQRIASMSPLGYAGVTDDIAAAVDLAVSEFGRLDVMFNNAGIVGAVGPIADMPVEAWDNTIAILLRGVFLGIKHAARVMTAQGSGVIISTSSTAGIVGGLGPHAYTAAKHGVIGLTKSVANELAPYGIRVNAISPGNTVTAMTASVTSGDPDDLERTTQRIASMSPLGYAGVPDDIAAAAVYLASDDARYVSGHTLVVDAGQTTAGLTPNRFNTGDSWQIHEAGRTS
jgi:NAD(P)-dependent dehydrogenase (short-subunit alcohol dehydrogenase family)